jgi:glycosyltransferase involved in cell wall biosynthesis
MTLGWDAPLPPARTGVADYASLLLHPLRQLGPVSSGSGDVTFYHLGNNRLHQEIYRRALAVPGAAVLHDAVLLHFHLGHCPDEAAFVSEFVFNYGRWHADLARRLWSRRASAEADEEAFRWPMLKRLCTGARAVVVHNSRAAELARRHAPSTPVFELPHPAFAVPPAPAARLEAWRGRLQLPRSLYVFAVLGFIRPQKRLAAVLRAFRRLHGEGVGAALLVAGDLAPASFAAALEPLLRHPAIIRVPYTSPPDFAALLELSDAVISLRHPSAGETSGIALRAMAAARPVFLTASEEAASFPAGSYLPIAHGAGEEDLLLEYMRWLAAEPDLGRRMGRLARAHLAAHHDPSLVAARYWEIARSL